MNYIGTILEILKAGLGIWNNHEKTKYLDQVLKIERAINEELKKPVYVPGMAQGFDYRNDITIEHGLRELAIIGRAFATAAGPGIRKGL